MDLLLEILIDSQVKKYIRTSDFVTILFILLAALPKICLHAIVEWEAAIFALF